MPFKIPANHSTLFATNPSLNAFITGVPPATDASKPIWTPYCLAILNKSSPWVAINALFAVTIFLPFIMAVSTNSLANWHPPINSTKTSISSLRATSIRFFDTFKSKGTADLPFLAPTLITSILTPPFLSNISGELTKLSRTAPPTLPTPHTPIFIDFIILLPGYSLCRKGISLYF